MSKRRDVRWRRFPPVQLLLYFLVRYAIMAIHMFPYRMAPRIARVVSRAVRTVDRKHARIAVKNLEKSRGVVEPDRIPEFIDGVYEHIGRAFVELLMIPRLMERHEISSHVSLERFHVFDDGLMERRGIIAVIAHSGNWEICGLAATLAGYPLNSLARPIENPWLDRYLTRFRTSTGQRIIAKYHALGEMIRVLRRNEILVIQADQDARRSGVYVEFFGRPASTQRSPALLALKYDAPIVIAEIFRDGDLNRCVLHDPIRPEAFGDHPDPVKALTQAYTARLEECIRRHPDQWFWIHDRWKTAERVARLDPAAVA